MKTIYSEDHKKLIEKLKLARAEAGLNQIEAAKLLKKTQSYVSKAESGQRRLDLVQLKQFARIYKKSINFFIS
jgi:transcriptional regulator with XRE-family HTH domain